MHSASSNGATHTFIDGVVDPGVVVNGAALVVVTTGAAGVVVSGAVVVTTAHSSSSLPSRQSTFSSQTHVSGMHSSPQENSPGHFLSQTGQHSSSSCTRAYPSSQVISGHICLVHNTAPWALAHLQVSHLSTDHVELTSVHSPFSNSHPSHVGAGVVTGDSVVVVGSRTDRHSQHTSDS